MKKVKEMTIEDKLKKEIKELKDDAKPYVAYKKLILNVAKSKHDPKDIIDSIKARFDSLPVLPPSQRTASIDELFKQFKYLDKDWWRTLNVTEKMRRMKEITGYTYEQLVQYVDAGWITPEQLDKLFNPQF